MNKATEEAKAERQRLLDEARKAADDLSAKRRETLRNEAHNLNQALGRRARQEVFAIARKTLADLAGSRAWKSAWPRCSLRRLREIGRQAKARLGDALEKCVRTRAGAQRVRVAGGATHGDTEGTRRNVRDAATESTVSVSRLHPDLIGGIELSANGQKVAWSIADYLASLENGVDELLKAKVQIQSAAEPGVEMKKS